MARASTTFHCTACGATAPRWYGRCPKCGEFATLVEQAPAAGTTGLRASARGATPARAARPVSEVVTGRPVSRQPTGVAEFDRVLGGGLVAGQVCLCSGPPGSGKSTLLLQIADSVARGTQRPVLYVSGEESVEQLAVRAQRVGAVDPHLFLADDTDLAAVLGHIHDRGPELALVVVDSVQTIASDEVDGRAGGITQTMTVAQVLTRVAKSGGVPFLLVGQVTKDATVAGPRALEHIVDTTLSLDGDRYTSLRLLRAVKNRFGPLEVAAFEQTDGGMEQVPDPSLLFREHRAAPVPGTCLGVTVEGNRAMTAELQALVAPTNNPNPRRAVTGLDATRCAMLIAVTERAARLRLYDRDVYLATVAGMRVSDPGMDLAVCLAIASAVDGVAVPLDTAVFGEVALSGDVRPVPMLGERVAEAARLGYQRLVVPLGTRERAAARSSSATLLEGRTVDDALQAVRPPNVRTLRPTH